MITRNPYDLEDAAEHAANELMNDHGFMTLQEIVEMKPTSSGMGQPPPHVRKATKKGRLPQAA